jgi:hypothetical protein
MGWSRLLQTRQMHSTGLPLRRRVLVCHGLYPPGTSWQTSGLIVRRSAASVSSSGESGGSWLARKCPMWGGTGSYSTTVDLVARVIDAAVVLAVGMAGGSCS